jgi:hypothetical protein
VRPSPATPARTRTLLVNAALIEKGCFLGLEAWERKRGARISSFIAVSDPLSSTAGVRDFPKRSCSS